MMGIHWALSKLSRAFGRPARLYEQRGAIRLKGRVRTATLRIQGREEVVRVHNVSRGGMMAETTMAPHIGERIEVVLDELGQTGAMVCWLEDGRIGVKFDMPLYLD